LSAGADTAVLAEGGGLAAPIVTYGRLMQPYWLRLLRAGGTVSASVSPDGKSWALLGTASAPPKGQLLVGLAACSRKPQITTTVMFDHVALAGPPGSPATAAR
jgi:regulation of enolase protein 1 (concanavalin A-like superfamily)